MTEKSWFWEGNSVGDAVDAPWGEDEFNALFRNFFTPLEADYQNLGVLPGIYTGDLATTNPAGTTIRVAPGAGFCYGSVYENTVNVDFTVVAPGAGTNYYTIVIQKTWATKQVVLALIGPSAVGYPAETRTPGTTYEVMISQVSITAASAIAITDQRKWFNPNTYKIPVWLGRLGPDRSSAALNWNEAHDYSTSFGGALNNHNGRIQGGVIHWTGAAAASGNVSITFPVPFAYVPMVLIQVYGTDAGIIASQSPIVSGTTIYWRDCAGTNHTDIDFTWIAFGPISAGY